MPQAKFSLSKAQVEFINRHQTLGYPDKSAMVREALDQLRARLAQDRLVESARLYAEVYAQEDDLHGLTDVALEDWPQ